MPNPEKRSYYFKKLKVDPERYQVYLEKDKQRKKKMLLLQYCSKRLVRSAVVTNLPGDC